MVSGLEAGRVSGEVAVADRPLDLFGVGAGTQDTALSATLEFLEAGHYTGLISHPPEYDVAPSMVKMSKHFGSERQLIIARNLVSAKHVGEALSSQEDVHVVEGEDDVNLNHRVIVITAGNFSVWVLTKSATDEEHFASVQEEEARAKRKEQLAALKIKEVSVVIIEGVDEIEARGRRRILHVFASGTTKIGFTTEDISEIVLGPIIYRVTQEEVEKQQAQEAVVAEVEEEGRDNHAHHYLVDGDRGPESKGKCKHCGKARVFNNVPTVDHNTSGKGTLRRKGI